MKCPERYKIVYQQKNPRLTRKQMQLRSVKRNAQREQLRCRKKKNGSCEITLSETNNVSVVPPSDGLDSEEWMNDFFDDWM